MAANFVLATVMSFKSATIFFVTVSLVGWVCRVIRLVWPGYRYKSCFDNCNKIKRLWQQFEYVHFWFDGCFYDEYIQC